MLGRDEIAEAARYTDARVEELGLPAWCRQYDIDTDGLVYVAEQRGLRMAMIESGIPIPEKNELSTVQLPVVAAEMVSGFAATWMDGFAAGYTAKSKGL